MIDWKEIDPRVVSVFNIILKHKFAMFEELKEYCKKENIPLKELDKLIIMARL